MWLRQSFSEQPNRRGRSGEADGAFPGGRAAPTAPRGQTGDRISPELACLHGVLPTGLLQAATRRGRELNLGADRVLVQRGLIDEAAYLHRLARHTHIPFDDLADIARSHCPLADHALPRAAQWGILPVRQDGKLTWVIAPRAFTARHLMRLAATYPKGLAQLRLTSRDHLQQFLTEQTGHILTDIAARGLQRRHPGMSAAPTPTPTAPPTPTPTSLPRAKHWPLRLTVLSLLLIAIIYPALTIDIVGGLAAIWFLAFSLLRLTCVMIPEQHLVALPRQRDDALPIYSVIIALYREAASVPGLLRALERLDYPGEKLDIILVLEPDDLKTRAAIARAKPGPNIRVLITQTSEPKTKPKALNVALPYAEGSFVTVFDAEDDPDPGQLRAALDVFQHHRPDVACVQAGLHFDNLTHSLFSRMASVEYAGLFSVFLPGLAALGMPLPLGGTSNHFRTDALREIGGWDAYNVTEDADLGIRLVRLGYRSVTLDSITLEEAPIAFGTWLRQRSRWMKGWIQTWAVHMRRPKQLWKEAGPRGFLAFNIIFGGNILTSLAFAVLIGKLVACVASGDGSALLDSRFFQLHAVAMIAGLAATCIIGCAGLARRGRLRDGWILALMPIYWGCLSIATWRALWQFWINRYHWEKTEHGLVQRAGTVKPASTWISRLAQRPALRRSA